MDDDILDEIDTLLGWKRYISDEINRLENYLEEFDDLCPDIDWQENISLCKSVRKTLVSLRRKLKLYFLMDDKTFRNYLERLKIVQRETRRKVHCRSDVSSQLANLTI